MRTLIIFILLAFLIPVMLFTIFATNAPDTLYSKEKKFYSQEFDPEAKIFLLGSSHIGQLNTTLINKRLIDIDTSYVVYNLAYNKDNPLKRLITLDDIISLQPKIVLIGVSYRDFEIENKTHILPDPHTYFTEIYSYVIEQTALPIEDRAFPNPLLTTLTTIRYFTIQNYDLRINMPNTPFMEYPSNQNIAKDEELITTVKSSKISSTYVGLPSNNYQLKALKKIIDKLHDNNIKIIVLATPLHWSYLDEISYEQKYNFNLILNEIKKSGTNVYDLSTKYSHLPIWLNPHHVALNKTSSIYSEDVAEIIKNEMG